MRNRLYTDPVKPLNISIISFSYRKGIPADPTRNGGGFVFDCRCLVNPGLLPEFANQTGLDEPVIRYLKEHNEADQFVENALAIVSQSIEAYQRMNYTHLMVCFGCTGGQHRSVYCAELLTGKIRAISDINVSAKHREQP